MKANLKYIIILIICVALLLIVELSRPRPIDWSESYSKDHKKPYGSFVLYEQLKNLFPQREIEASEETIYRGTKDVPQDTNTNYILINNIFSPNIFESNKLLDFVRKGNSAFIAANGFYGSFADSLKLGTDFVISYPDSVALNFVSPFLKCDKDITVKSNEGAFCFSKFDTANSVVLGENNRNRVTFIKLKFGKGTFYLSTVPIVYTNYYLLYMDFAEYAAKSFSYLPAGNIIWDEYYKVNKTHIQNPLRFVVNNESLAWAYYLILAGFVLFIIFRGKRVQRIIPVIAPIKNTSLEFISIISKLYFHTKDHKSIAQKRILYLLDFIRAKYYLKTNKLTKQFRENLSQKSGVSLKNLNDLFAKINRVNKKVFLTENELIQLNQQIDKFYERVDT